MSQAYPFLLVAVRLTGMMLGAPLFNLRQLPHLWKAGLALLGALLTAPLVAVPAPPPTLFALAVAVVWELSVGWLTGSLAALATAIALSAGGVLDLQIGLANATVLNPSGQEAHPLLANLLQTAMLLVLLAADAHHALLVLVIKSYLWFPAQGSLDLSTLARLCTGAAACFFPMLLAVVLPVMTAMLGVELVLAFLGRLLPQVNIMLLGAPLRLMLGWFLLLASLPVTLNALEQVWRTCVGQW